MNIMSLRILMIGNDLDYITTDGAVLREKGIRVYLNDNRKIVNDLIDEIKPDLVFIDWQTPDKNSTDTYHALLDNVRYASIPVVYTLAEDDVYLVNRKRTAARDRRYVMSDNFMDAIRLALTGKQNKKPLSAGDSSYSLPLPPAARAFRA